MAITLQVLEAQQQALLHEWKPRGFSVMNIFTVSIFSLKIWKRLAYENGNIWSVKYLESAQIGKN